MANCSNLDGNPAHYCADCVRKIKAELAEAKAQRGSANIDALIRQRDRLVELAIDVADSIAIVTHTGEADGIVRNHISQNIAKLTAYLKAENLHGHLQQEACGEDCKMCSGEVCKLCGAGSWNNDPDRNCQHDVIDRHREPEGE